MRTEALDKINSRLKQIFNNTRLSPEKRGELGEEAIYELVQYWGSSRKIHILESSYIFPQGKIHPTIGSKESEPVTEIDILIVTPYRIFVLEVKTIYGTMRVHPSHKIEITRTESFNGEFESKNYLQQNEMHARHLYYHLHKYLPEGDPKWIVPVLVMTGKMKFEDLRDRYMMQKYPITNANTLIKTLDKYNTPDKYSLDVEAISKVIKDIRVFDKQRLLNSQKFD